MWRLPFLRCKTVVRNVMEDGFEEGMLGLSLTLFFRKEKLKECQGLLNSLIFITVR